MYSYPSHGINDDVSNAFKIVNTVVYKAPDATDLAQPADSFIAKKIRRCGVNTAVSTRWIALERDCVKMLIKRLEVGGQSIQEKILSEDFWRFYERG